MTAPAHQASPDALGSVTPARVMKIALPIVLSNATVPLLGIVDTAVVGQLGAAAPLGAVAVGAIILSSLYWVFGFLRMGTVGLASQARGQGDTGEVAALLTRVVLIGAGAGLAMVVLQVPLIAGALWLASPSAEVTALAQDYLVVRIWSAPAMIAIYGLSGWLIAQERSQAFMAVQIWMNGLNIVLDVWFVLGLGWGVSGVAFATFLAEWSGLALGLWFCRTGFQGLGLAQLGAGVEGRAAVAHGVCERRYSDPVAVVAGDVHLLHLHCGAAGRLGAGGQSGVDADDAAHRLWHGWICLCC